MAAHARRASGPVTTGELGELWWSENAKLYGGAVQMIPAYRFGWSYIPHFVHSRFYCYAYAFGELLTLALFQRYRSVGPAFAADYLELLASGGNRDPAALLRDLGFDIRDPAFWDGGCAIIAAMVDEVKSSL